MLMMELYVCTLSKIFLCSAGGISLTQLQESLKDHLNPKCNFTEYELESYMQSYISAMADSIWKLNVVDIEETLSHVCQMVCPHVLTTPHYS
jgi:hypothetical protein